MRPKRTSSIELIFAVSIMAGACTKDFVPRQQSFPLIQTTAVTNIDDGGAQFNGQLIKTGTDPVLDFGFKYVERPDSLFKTVPDTFSVSIGGEFTNKFSIKVNHNLNIYLKYNVMAYAMTAKETVIGNAVIFKSATTSPIQITSFSPRYVLDGDTLTILGENFNRYGSDLVFIEGKLQLNVLQYNSKLVTVTVPPISQAGPIEVIVDAFYSKTNSNQLIAINPSITSIFPTHGPVGEVITLNGRFSSNVDYNKVFFNGVEATVSKSSKNQIAVYLPAGVSGNASVTINVNGKTGTALNTFLVE